MKGYNRPELNHKSLSSAMRRHPPNPPPSSSDATNPKVASRGDWATLQTLLPYLWVYKWRVLAALACLIGAKIANVGVPLVLKQLIDALGVSPSNPQALLVLPVGALAAYGALRLSTTVFTELREFLFARVTQRAVRTIALQVFRHLHALSLRFHLNRQTGGMTRDIERADRDDAGAGLPGASLRNLVQHHHCRRAGDLHYVHGAGDELAHPFPAHHERPRFEGQHPCHRLADQLRNGQVLRQREL
jgi:hypothetical protein